jgi:hypothetical protein
MVRFQTPFCTRKPTHQKLPENEFFRPSIETGPAFACQGKCWQKASTGALSHAKSKKKARLGGKKSRQETNFTLRA